MKFIKTIGKDQWLYIFQFFIWQKNLFKNNKLKDQMILQFNKINKSTNSKNLSYFYYHLQI